MVPLVTPILTCRAGLGSMPASLSTRHFSIRHFAPHVRARAECGSRIDTCCVGAVLWPFVDTTRYGQPRACAGHDRGYHLAAAILSDPARAGGAALRGAHIGGFHARRAGLPHGG